MRIYIAGPLTADTDEAVLQNCQKAIDAGIELMRMGHVPFVPHLMQWFDARAKSEGVNFSWEVYINWCLAWLEQCEALLFLGPSPGANIELEAAKKAGKRIFYSVDEIV